MSGDPVDDAGGYEEEGIEAFNRMADAMQALQSHLSALDAALGGKVAQAERTASKAEAAAAYARQAAEQAAAGARAGALSAASWATLGAVLGLLASGGAGYWLGHLSGQENGLARGYRAAMDEKAAASWANTPTGQLAQALDRAGSLDQLARCNGRGWTMAVQPGRKVCLPNAAGGKGAADGWNVP